MAEGLLARNRSSHFRKGPHENTRHDRQDQESTVDIGTSSSIGCAWRRRSAMPYCPSSSSTSTEPKAIESSSTPFTQMTTRRTRAFGPPGPNSRENPGSSVLMQSSRSPAFASKATACPWSSVRASCSRRREAATASATCTCSRRTGSTPRQPISSTSVGGSFTVAGYDFKGVYGVYRYHGSVIFEEWEVEGDPVPHKD